MDGELRKLINDPRFREYHRDSLQREFNTFDVLRYADYEIRHSNVLAWLLQPAETHGIDDQFLKWFLCHVNAQIKAANGTPLPPVNLEAANVRVERELDYVDITIFFKKEQCLVAIENKTGPATSDHFNQVRGYEETLRGKYKNHTLKSVLLTTLPMESGDSSGIVQVGWKSVDEAIGSLQEDGVFHPGGVEAFVRQYRELLERQFGFTEGGVRSLLDDHRPILEKMIRLLDKDGADSVWEKVPEDRTEYRDALVRLVQESRQDPKQLRKAMANYLKSRGCETWLSQTHKAPKWYSVNWRDRELEETSRLLSGASNFLNWSMTFTHRNVSVGFYLYPYRPGKKQENPSLLDRLIRFMKDTPIDRLETDKYRIKDMGEGCHRVYHQPILSKDEFADMSVFENRDEGLRRLKDFMDSNESDYRRIDDYFRCLAFKLDVSTLTREEVL